MARSQPVKKTAKRVRKIKPLDAETKAWATYLNDVRANAAGDTIAPVELQRARVHYGTSAQYVEPNYTKDRSYQHGPLPSVPKSQRLWT
jgi:hypothetical protein